MWSTTHASKRQCSIAVPTCGTINRTNGLMDGQTSQQGNNTISVSNIQQRYHENTTKLQNKKYHENVTKYHKFVEFTMNYDNLSNIVS